MSLQELWPRWAYTSDDLIVRSTQLRVNRIVKCLISYHLICFQETGLEFPLGVADRLCAYARSVGHFPTALKEYKVNILASS